MIFSVRHAQKFCIRLLITRFSQMILMKFITKGVSAHIGLIFFFFLLNFFPPLCPLVVNYTNACCLHETKWCSLPTWHCKFNVTFISGGGNRDPQTHPQANVWLMKCTESWRPVLAAVCQLCDDFHQKQKKCMSCLHLSAKSPFKGVECGEMGIFFPHSQRCSMKITTNLLKSQSALKRFNVHIPCYVLCFCGSNAAANPSVFKIGSYCLVFFPPSAQIRFG